MSSLLAVRCIARLRASSHTIGAFLFAPWTAGYFRTPVSPTPSMGSTNFQPIAMSDTRLIKDKIDIVDFVGEYVQLKPAGSNHKGLCPFHREKSPSFMVSRDRQSWHCFGCGKGGDVFSFLQEIEGMEFIEALKYLANRAGVPLDLKRSDAAANEKNRLRDIVNDAVHFYHNFLLKMSAAKPAQEYLERRGLTPETIDAWQIGFVPDQWDLLTRYLTKKGHSIDDLVTVGLTIKRDGASPSTGRGFYDRFRGRILFPLTDLHGIPIGFTGRVLVETEQSGGKYVNTPQSPLFDKSSVIFGLSKAKQAIKQHDVAVLVEGQMDVISSHQAGITHVVATSGTAMTEQHVRLLKRYTNNLAMAFDMDEAGQRAAKRGIDIAVAEGMNVRVIRIPEGAGADPDECIKKNPDVWREAIERAQDVMQWYIDGAFSGRDLKNPKDTQQIANILLPELARIPFAIERDRWLQQIAAKLGIGADVLRQELPQGVGPQLSRSAETTPAAAGPAKTQTRMGQLIQELLALVLTRPDVSLPRWERALPTYPLYERIRSEYTTGVRNSSELVAAAADAGFSAECQALLLKGDEEFCAMEAANLAETATELLARIEQEWIKTERLRLTHAIEQAEAAGDTAALAALLKEFQHIHT